MSLFKTLTNWFKKTVGGEPDGAAPGGHQNELLNRLKNAPRKESPPGWELSVHKDVGGLRHIGFSEKQPGKLLVISSAGKSIIDGYSGRMLFRDPDDENYDAVKLISEGVADLRGETIRLAGITGGGLPIINAGGEAIMRCALDFPDEIFIFTPPGQWIYFDNPFKRMGCCTIHSPICDYVAHGFSPRGDLLVIADTATLKMWKKK